MLVALRSNLKMANSLQFEQQLRLLRALMKMKTAIWIAMIFYLIAVLLGKKINIDKNESHQLRKVTESTWAIGS